MQAQLDLYRKQDPENVELQDIKINLKMQPLSGYCRHMPNNPNYYKSIIKPEAYLRH